MLKSNILLTLIAIIILIIVAVPSQLLFNDPNFQQQLSDYIPSGIEGAFILFFVLSLLTSISLPRQIAAFIGGYCFGFLGGVAIATLAATLGCWLTFSFARKYLANYLQQRFLKQQQVVINFLSDDLFYKAIIIRLLPIGSNFLTNLIAGACKLNRQQFIAGSFIGFIPQMVIFSLAGAGIKLASKTHLLSSAGLFIVAFLLSYWLFNKHKNSQLRQ